METGPKGPGRSGYGILTSDAVELYKLAVAHPAWTAVELTAKLGYDCDRFNDAVCALKSLQLLRPALDPAREWVPVGPEPALAELVVDEELELSRRAARVEQLKREVLGLLPTYFEARRGSHQHEAIDTVPDGTMVQRLLTYRAECATKEIRIARSGGGMSAEDLGLSLAREISVLRRGVDVQIVVQHSTRHHLPTRDYVVAVTPHGADVRTVPVVPRSLTLFDREIAIMSLEGTFPGGGAALIKEPVICDYLFQFFKLQWAAGRPYPATNADDHEESRDDLWQAILNHLACGDKDELISRRLGISVRTCRRHIAAIMESLGANSRFQAGVLAQQRGILNV